ncbi:MAG: ACP phosphodiesterase [Paludibacter sp.]
MNYLAHIFLSDNKPGLQIGNFIADFVKGSKLNHFPTHIREGIVLHRKIDTYTDAHYAVHETIALLRPTFGRYSGIIVDMYFDHFLAKNFSTYAEKPLNKFAFHFYFFTLIYYKHLPSRVKGFIFHFITTNRLKKYATISGLKNSLEIMSAYKISALKPEETIDFLINNYADLEKKFHLFFPDLVEFVRKERV